MKQKDSLSETLTQLRGEAYKNAMEKGFHGMTLTLRFSRLGNLVIL